MNETIKGVQAFFKDKTDRATQSVHDFVDHEDTKAMVAWTKNAANTVADEAVDIGKNTVNSVNAFIEHDDTKAAVAWTKETIGSAADEAVELGKRAVQSDMTKDAAAGAAVGAAVAIPIPIIGPVFGAVVGAGIGVFKNLKSGNSKNAQQLVTNSSAPRLDLYKELTELDDLRQKGILTEDEFLTRKRSILRQK